jgi:hypothetical protein
MRAQFRPLASVIFPQIFPSNNNILHLSVTGMFLTSLVTAFTHLSFDFLTGRLQYIFILRLSLVFLSIHLQYVSSPFQASESIMSYHISVRVHGLSRKLRYKRNKIFKKYLLTKSSEKILTHTFSYFST